MVKPFTMLISEDERNPTENEASVFSATYCMPCFCRIQALLYQLPIVGSFVVVQKVISNQFECFPCCLLSSLYYFIKIPIIYKLIYLRTGKDLFFYLCITDTWKLLLLIPKTFPILVHGLHKIVISPSLM